MKRKLLFLSPLLLALCACDFSFSIITPTSSNQSRSPAGSDVSQSVKSAEQYSQEGAVVKQNVYDKVILRDVGLSLGMDYLPPSGEVNLLVLPIEMKGEPFADNFATDLDHALNGDSSETGYWESLSSFYEKSSFGQSKLHFEIADTYHANLTAAQALSANQTLQGGDSGAYFVEEALKQYKASNDVKKYDVDSNGWIDGIIAVYSSKDSQTARRSADRENYFWAYTYWLGQEPDRRSPSGNLYFWLSYDFIYEAVSSPKVDSHTLVHETGHMYGLDDYYPDGSSKFDPVGGLDMMSHNILDHNTYSKMSLGWVDPYVVTGEAEITINASYINGDCILIPGVKADGSIAFNGSVFDEYMLVELYSPKGLNYLDSHHQYPNRTYGFKQPGVKIFHVDSRLTRFSIDSFGERKGISYVEDPSEVDPYSNTYYMIGATNCTKDFYNADPSYSLIQLIEASGRNSFRSGGLATDNSLFHKGDSFSLSNVFGNAFFPKKTTLNNDASFPYEIKVTALSEDAATISVTLK